MRVGVIVRMEADTDINEKFAEVRAMGMESCQLVCWETEDYQRMRKASRRPSSGTGISLKNNWGLTQFE